MGWLGCLLDSIYLAFSFCWLDAEIICKSQRLSETSGNIRTYSMICDDLLEKHKISMHVHIYVINSITLDLAFSSLLQCGM